MYMISSSKIDHYYSSEAYQNILVIIDLNNNTNPS